MMPSEAAICGAPSRFFTGLCFSSKNCSEICEKDGFLFGKCKMLKCICKKDCGGPGGGGAEGGEPGEGGEEPGEGGEEPGEGGEEPGEGGEEPSVLSRKSLINS
ncbi:hypothetical protein ACS0TY_033080 [Phlomoides rotata]